MRLQKHRTLQFLLQKVTNEITKSDHYIGHYNFYYKREQIRLQKVTITSAITTFITKGNK